MRRFFLAPLFLALFASNALAATEQEVVDEATVILRRFQNMPEKAIPRRVLRNARGLAIMSVFKAGFVFSGKGGQGVVVARTPDGGWSGPSFIGMGGAGWGLQVGAQRTEFVFVLNSDAAVRAFSKNDNVTLGGDLSATAGPVGRNLHADVTLQAAIYTYSRSQGLFAGASLEGAVIATQKTANARYYGRPVRARNILSGGIAPPRGAERLLGLLNR